MTRENDETTPDCDANATSRGERLDAPRKALLRLRVDAFLVPRADEHQGEYVAQGSNNPSAIALPQKDQITLSEIFNNTTNSG